MLPISYGDAQPLLAALTGPVAPEEWRGALADSRITWAPARPKVHLKVAFNWDIKPIYDVIATMPGGDGAGRMGDSRQSSRRMGERRGGPDFRADGAAGRGASAGRAA